MDAEERRALYQVYNEDCRALAYHYVGLVLESISKLPPEKGDTIVCCTPPQMLFPSRTGYPREADLFRQVALLLTKEHRFNVKWRKVRPCFIYVRWMDVVEGEDEIDTVGNMSSGDVAMYSYLPRVPASTNFHLDLDPAPSAVKGGLQLDVASDTSWLDKLRQMKGDK